MEKSEVAPSALPNPDQFTNGYEYYEALKLSLGFAPEGPDESEGLPVGPQELIENENCVIRHSDMSGYGDEYHVYFPKERKVLLVTINEDLEGNIHEVGMHGGDWSGPFHSFSVHEYSYDEYNQIYNNILKAPEAK